MSVSFGLFPYSLTLPLGHAAHMELDFSEQICCQFMLMLCHHLSVHVSEPKGDIYKLIGKLDLVLL